MVRLCSVEGCTRPHFVHGLCSMHRDRVRRRGGVATTPGCHAPLSERFWRFVTRGATEECWLWQGARNRIGYGHLASAGGRQKKTLQAHRVAYELLIGPVPVGMDLDHLCCTTSCCNPAHMEPVTRNENVRRQHARTRNRRAVA